MKSTILFLIFLTIGSSLASYFDESWQWSWNCNEKVGRCERVQSSSNRAEFNPKLPQYGTLPACRLICGKYGALWPRPTISTSITQQLVPFHPSSISYDLGEASDEKLKLLTDMLDIFKNNLLTDCGENCSGRSETNITIYITTQLQDVTLLAGTDESYSVEITTKDSAVSVKIAAETVFGARHGLETVTQLVAPCHEPTNGSMELSNGLVIVAGAKIKDKPIYAYRGLLLDTARNFLPIETIKRQMNAMAASKLNVMHWHATDSQSFPIESPRLPNLSRYGSYSPKKIFTLDDIRDLHNYAKRRGIRIIMEIDAPSHAGNGWQWGESAGLGKLAVCVNQQPWRQSCIQPPCGQLNPANQKVYDALADLYKDLQDVTTSGEYFHMGGDEVFFPCWNNTEEIISYMTSQGLKRNKEDFLKLWGEFQSKALKAYDSQLGNEKTSIILWSSDLTDPEFIERFLSKDRYIVETWVPASNNLPIQLLDKGYRLIISTKDAWYLDHGFYDHGGTVFHNWRIVYQNRILRHDGVLGGEVCMWGELVDDGPIDSRVWPRAAAAAERLWSDPDENSAAAEIRFYSHRERLVKRGIQAEALAPRWCYQNEGQCM